MYTFTLASRYDPFERSVFGVKEEIPMELQIQLYGRPAARLTLEPDPLSWLKMWPVLFLAIGRGIPTAIGRSVP